MPKVGTQHFAYTQAGVQAAKKAAKKTGQKMVVNKAKMPKKGK